MSTSIFSKTALQSKQELIDALNNQTQSQQSTIISLNSSLKQAMDDLKFTQQQLSETIQQKSATDLKAASAAADAEQSKITIVSLERKADSLTAQVANHLSYPGRESLRDFI